MLALTRDLGNSMTSTMVAVRHPRPAGNRRPKFCVPRRLWGRRCRHQSAKTRSLTPPIKSSEISIEIAQSQKWTEQGGLLPEVGIGCLVTHGVPEVAHVLRRVSKGGGAWIGRGGGCLQRPPGLPARLDPGSRVLGTCAVAARDCGASLKVPLLAGGAAALLFPFLPIDGCGRKRRDSVLALSRHYRCCAPAVGVSPPTGFSVLRGKRGICVAVEVSGVFDTRRPGDGKWGRQ